MPQSRYVQLSDSRPFDSTGVEVCHDSDCPHAPIDVAQQLVGDNPDATVDELVAALQLTDEDVNCLCAATVQQSLCDTRFKQKQGRVTASDFGQIASKMKTLQRKQVSTDKLVGKIMGYTKSPNTAALNHELINKTYTVADCALLQQSISVLRHHFQTAVMQFQPISSDRTDAWSKLILQLRLEFYNYNLKVPIQKSESWVYVPLAVWFL